jgi:hypothetical protein
MTAFPPPQLIEHGKKRAVIAAYNPNNFVNVAFIITDYIMSHRFCQPSMSFFMHYHPTKQNGIAPQKSSRMNRLEINISHHNQNLLAEKRYCSINTFYT